MPVTKEAPAYRVGIDVGGTFTDLFAWDPGSGLARTAKVLTTPGDLSDGVLAALHAAGIEPAEVDVLVHGSTTAINALLTRRYPEPALITTEGYRDVIEIRRMYREHLYDPYQVKPRPLVRRRHRYTVAESIDAHGGVREPLDEDAVRAITTRIAARGIRSVAIGFLNSYVNPAHERRAAEIVAEEAPGTLVALSSDIPKFRELPRFMTAVVRAALLPVMGDYLDRLERRLETMGFAGRLCVINSNGGVMHVGAALKRPEELIQSGPAGGVAAASYLSALTGQPNLVSTDMGGTSFDVCLIENGQGLVHDEYAIEFDTPIAVPMLDIRSVGSGGGSIAWIDEGGSLRVGPQSAGSEPGPACYGRGGTAATVTDANLVLGRLDPTLGGKTELDQKAAEDAIAAIAGQLGIGLLECAEGIIEITAESMAAAIKMVSTDKGRDPRDFSLVSFGGAGAMHAWAIAPSVGMTRVLVPRFAGVASAFGATVMDVRYDAEATLFTSVSKADLSGLNECYARLEEQVTAALNEEGFSSDGVTLSRTAGMRYEGQSYEVMTTVPAGELTTDSMGAIVEAFHVAHEREHGTRVPSFEVAFVNLRVTGSGVVPKPDLASLELAVPTLLGGEAPRVRRAFFGGQFVDTAIVSGPALRRGATVIGPAIIEYPEAQVVVPPGATAMIDAHGDLEIHLTTTPTDMDTATKEPIGA